MSIFDSRYFRINKFFLSITGLWPHLSVRKKQFIRTFITVVIILHLIPTIGGLYEVWGKLDLMVECFIPIFTAIGCLVCAMTYIFKEKELTILFNHIESDWELFSSAEDIGVFQRHAEDGRILTLLYTGSMGMATCIYLLTTISPQILDIILPLNETRPKRLSSNVHYFFDWKDYFSYVFIHLLITCLVETAIVAGCRSTFSVLSEHACGLFSNVGNRLRNIMKSINFEKMNLDSHFENIIHRDVIHCIEYHKQAIEFSKIIESCFSTCFFIIMGITVILISATLIQTVAHLDRINDASRFGAYALGLIIDLYFNNLPAQRLLDHSSCYLSDNIFTGMWYQMPLKSKKLLVLMIMRTHYPSTLTAGKIFIMNMNNFSAVLHASVSYFTLLSSLRA